MVMITFLTAVVGLSITGFTLMFSASAYARLSSVAAVGVAAIVVGGLVTAQLNGGRPYGYDLPVGLDQWRAGEPHRDAPAVPKPQLQPHQDDGPPIA
jgi:hypothetical protein